jgi:hypothetical protein
MNLSAAQPQECQVPKNSTIINIAISGSVRHLLEVHLNSIAKKHTIRNISPDRLCSQVVTVPGYRPRGPGLDSWRYQIFLVDLERDPLSLVRINEELPERKVAARV